MRIFRFGMAYEQGRVEELLKICYKRFYLRPYNVMKNILRVGVFTFYNQIQRHVNRDGIWALKGKATEVECKQTSSVFIL